MRQSTAARRSGALLAVLVPGGGLAGSVTLDQVVAAVARLDPAAPVTDDVRLAATFVLLGAAGVLVCWSWLLLCVAVALRDACSGRPVRPPGVLRPAALRAGLGLAAATTLAGVGGAHAVPPPGPDQPDAVPLPSAVAGLVLPDRVHDSGPGPVRRVHSRVPPDRSTSHGPPAPRTLRVRPGDTLWQLTEELLRSRSRGAPVPTQAVDHGWRLLHRTNRAVIGADPDLLRPGALLRVPKPLAPPGPRTGEHR